MNDEPVRLSLDDLLALSDADFMTLFPNAALVASAILQDVASHV